jgi:hypothetical protein
MNEAVGLRGCIYLEFDDRFRTKVWPATTRKRMDSGKAFLTPNGAVALLGDGAFANGLDARLDPKNAGATRLRACYGAPKQGWEPTGPAYYSKWVEIKVPGVS